MLSLPITLLILLVALGALVAASVPLCSPSPRVMATMALVAIPSQLFPLGGNVDALILLIGLAVGVDYSLFYMRREREERAAGRSNRDATRGGRGHLGPRGDDLRDHGDDRDGRDVHHRRGDVHLVRGRHRHRGRGRDVRDAGGPAGGAGLARRPRREGPDPVHPAPPRPAGESRFWSAIVTRVMRRPLVSIVVAGGLLVALAIPASA